MQPLLLQTSDYLAFESCMCIHSCTGLHYSVCCKMFASKMFTNRCHNGGGGQYLQIEFHKGNYHIVEISQENNILAPILFSN